MVKNDLCCQFWEPHSKWNKYCVLFQMVLGRVLKAQVVLRGLVIEWVKVKGYNEDFITDDGKVGGGYINSVQSILFLLFSFCFVLAMHFSCSLFCSGNALMQVK